MNTNEKDIPNDEKKDFIKIQNDKLDKNNQAIDQLLMLVPGAVSFTQADKFNNIENILLCSAAIIVLQLLSHMAANQSIRFRILCARKHIERKRIKQLWKRVFSWAWDYLCTIIGFFVGYYARMITFVSSYGYSSEQSAQERERDFKRSMRLDGIAGFMRTAAMVLLIAQICLIYKGYEMSEKKTVTPTHEQINFESYDGVFYAASDMQRPHEPQLAERLSASIKSIVDGWKNQTSPKK